MTTAILYAYQRDGVLHPATICTTPKLAEEAARVYCCYTVQDKPNTGTMHGQAWDYLTKTGRVQPVELYCRILPMKDAK